ncbi:la-related protein 7 [Anopheles ziemanni]|uniref:la-related protein 7 n=1 Tax=Anopheles coustani TaxID=139045 RepID=UPI00265A07D4|nr:la-related protein 7 [Anopheles coustani]XP_058176424.1 la-related protein 7 [Anopheles ziemanni]
MASEKQIAASDDSKDKTNVNKGRHRKKHKYNAIRTQIEFYFSDANLSKDRYMGQLMQNDPCIPLEEFLKFNKIKALASNVEEIATSLKSSTFLTLSDDQSKVRRTTNPSIARDNEPCTLYVESLPPKANHDWVRNVFSAYGKVAYVSLPTFKHSKKIKEFGFVEFEEEASVQKALKAFQTFGGVLAFETTDPAKMASIKTFDQEKRELEQQSTGGLLSMTEGKSEDEIHVGSPGIKEEEQFVVKQENETDPQPGEESLEPPAKKIKTDTSEGEDTQDESHTDLEDPTEEEENETEKEAEKDESAPSTKQVSTAQEGKKKCRQRKGCSTIKKELQLDDKMYELKIMTKQEWRRLRNKYLNLQRNEAKKLKKLFAHSDKHPQRGHPKTNASNVVGGIAMKSIKSSPRVNFYGAMPIEDDQSEMEEAVHQPEMADESVALTKQPLFSFEPGLIVSVKFREPCVDVKDFRAELRQYPYVKYIDVKEGAFEAFVRVDKPASANALVKEYSSAEHSAQILSGELEQQYWNKMMRDRDDKLNKRVKPEKVRGRTKLIRKIASHIKFDDDDD